jgi:hypothetical protein
LSMHERIRVLASEWHLTPQIVNTTAAVVTPTGREGKIVLFNPACETAIARRATEPVARLHADVPVDPARRSGTQRAGQPVQKGEAVFSMRTQALLNLCMNARHAGCWRHADDTDRADRHGWAWRARPCRRDDDGVRRDVRRALSTLGYTVTDSADPVAALARQRRPGLPVLYMAGYADRRGEDGRRAIAAGRLLHKPFQRTELRQAVGDRLAAAAAKRA